MRPACPPRTRSRSCARSASRWRWSATESTTPPPGRRDSRHRRRQRHRPGAHHRRRRHRLRRSRPRPLAVGVRPPCPPRHPGEPFLGVRLQRGGDRPRRGGKAQPARRQRPPPARGSGEERGVTGLCPTIRPAAPGRLFVVELLVVGFQNSTETHPGCARFVRKGWGSG